MREATRVRRHLTAHSPIGGLLLADSAGRLKMRPRSSALAFCFTSQKKTPPGVRGESLAGIRCKLELSVALAKELETRLAAAGRSVRPQARAIPHETQSPGRHQAAQPLTG